MDSKPYPAQHQPRLVDLILALRAAQRGGECRLDARALALVMFVAAQEAQLGYAKPPTFRPAQLCSELGIAKWETLDEVRAAAVASGWLHYENRGRSAGAYWTVMPCAFHVERSYPPQGDDRRDHHHGTDTSRGDVSADGIRRADTIAADDLRGSYPSQGDDPGQSPPQGDDPADRPPGMDTSRGDPSKREKREEQQLLQQPRAGDQGGGEGAGTATAAAPRSVAEALAGVEDPAVRARLTPLGAVTLGLRPGEVAEDLPAWISVTDGLSAEQVAMVLVLRHKHPPKASDGRAVVFRHPTHFAQLRAVFEASQRALAARRAADRDAAAAAARKAQDATIRDQAQDRRGEVDPALAAGWATALAALRPPVGAAERRGWETWLADPKVYPLAIDQGRLVLHVPTPLFQFTISDRYAAMVLAAAAEALGQALSGITYVVNGAATVHAERLAAIPIGVAP